MLDIRRARLIGRSGTWRIGIAHDHIAAITPEAADADPTIHTFDLDVDGAAVVPAFVEPHVHLDKAHTYDAVAAAGGPFGGLEDALAATADVLDTASAPQIAVRGDRLLRELAGNGVVAARAHVEVGAGIGLASVAAHLELRDRWAESLDLQLVAFPQRGFETDPYTVDLLDEAMRVGCDAVGGCPYVDDDQASHVEIVFDLAQRWSRPVDLHLDLSDDPRRSALDEVIARSTATGIAVTVGHLTTLGVLSRDDARRRADAIAAAGIAVVVLPTTDLYLGGRSGDGPTLRAVAPLRQLFDAGVVTALGTNNVDNAFTPFGTVHPLRLAWLAGLIGHLGDPADHRRLLEAVTSAAGAAIGHRDHDLAVGAPADLVVLDGDDPAAAVRTVPSVRATVRRGCVRQSEVRRR